VTRDVGIKGSGTSYTFSKSGTATWTWWGTCGTWSVLSWDPNPLKDEYEWYSDPDWRYVNDGGGGGAQQGIMYSSNVKEKTTVKYKLFYKIAGELYISDLGISNKTRDYEKTMDLIDTDQWQGQETNQSPAGQMIHAVSCQINKTNMVYTFIVMQYNATTKRWDFLKRIIGIINIADRGLPPGYRQEFEVYDSNAAQFFTNNFDLKAYAAIGVHKSK
jgi:hypothetical protein